jgi:hypothetical protein
MPKVPIIGFLLLMGLRMSLLIQIRRWVGVLSPYAGIIDIVFDKQ